MQNIGQDTIKNLIHPLPPRSEQERIGAWMHGAAQSDSCLETKLQLTVAKLEEYRAAMITAAVTGKIAQLA